MTVKLYKYRGWKYSQIERGHWAMQRLSDGFTTFHNSHGGCLAFIRLHGHAPNPDVHYEEDDERSLVQAATAYIDPDKL